jgi:hypothetical protein
MLVWSGFCAVGIRVLGTDLVDLNALVIGQSPMAERSKISDRGVCLSCGGSDEFMRFFLYRKVWKRADIIALEGKLSGLR